MAVLALDTEQAKTIAIVVIIALVALVMLVSAIVKAIIGRAVVLIVALALAGAVWSQRSEISSAAKKCDATFFGVHLTPSNPTLKQKCRSVAN